MQAQMPTAPVAVVTTAAEDGRELSSRWSALRAAASRRGTARLRRELAALRDSLAEIEPSEPSPPLHTKNHLHRRIDELNERLSRLLETKGAMLKLAAAARRAMAADDTDPQLETDLGTTLATWDELHVKTYTELRNLETARTAWSEWEAGLRELSSDLRSDRDALHLLRHGKDPAEQLSPPLRRLADVLCDKQSGSTCGSLSDSGISDGDSEAAAAAEAAAGARARRLAALRDLARDLTHALAPGSHAIRAITKRMEQAESEVRALQESCRALVARGSVDLADTRCAEVTPGAGGKTDAGDPDYRPRRGWVWRVMRSALPFQLCLVALVLAAWLLERPRCCDLLNTLAASLTPQLRYVRGPPPV